MILLVDAGNNSCKWAVTQQGQWLQRGRFMHEGAVTPELFAAAWSELNGVERVVVSNVAGKGLGHALRDWVKGAWSLDVEFLTPRRRLLGVTNAYAYPQRLGADRWAAMLAAHANMDGAVCIVDCGSAITIDALGANGEHKGGLILPGLHMMRRSLVDNAHGISENVLSDAGDGAVSILATDTQGAVAGGVLYAAVAFIERVSADLAAVIPDRLTRVITGGDAQKLLPLLNGDYMHEPDLVLQGLALYAGTRQ